MTILTSSSPLRISWIRMCIAQPWRFKSYLPLFLITVSLMPCHAQSVLQNQDGIPSSLLQIPTDSNFYSPYAFVVDKSTRQLTIWHQSAQGLKEVARYPADLGKNLGEKKSQGDHKTPEGIYFLLEKHEGETLDFNLYGKRAFTTDYPNFFDRVEGKTGGGIWLHAVPDHVPLTRGSRGCVVVRNDVILDVSQYVKLGRTPILILDHLQTLPHAEVSKASAEVTEWLENWRSSWETKKINDYIEYYGANFRSMRMNKNQWRKYKQRLANSYKSIHVRLSKPAIFIDRDNAVVRFIQEYTSDLHSDVGEKVLYLKKSEKTPGKNSLGSSVNNSAGNSGSSISSSGIASRYQIIGESWSEDSSDLARQEVERTKTSSPVSASSGASSGASSMQDCPSNTTLPCANTASIPSLYSTSNSTSNSTFNSSSNAKSNSP